MTDFATQLRAALADRRMSLRGASRALNYDPAYISRVANGKQWPSAELARALDELLDTGGALAEASLKARPIAAPQLFHSLLRLNEARGEEYAQAIRDTSQQLVRLDNEINGISVAEAAARSFQIVHRQLGSGSYESRFERSIRSAAAELAEVAGWTLFDAGKYRAARRFNQEALFLARLSGDRSMELLILQNMGMLAGWLGRPREELTIARSALDRKNLSPKVQSIFRVREARGLSALGNPSETARSFALARSLLSEGGRKDDPFWAWWVSEQEVTGHESLAHQGNGEWGKAIPLLQENLEGGITVGYQKIYGARLLTSYLKSRSWKDAEDLAESLTASAGEISSERTLEILRSAARQSPHLDGIPGGLREALHHLGTVIDEDPFSL
jgi:transcriptional regulator with XRE-family HTH domain